MKTLTRYVALAVLGGASSVAFSATDGSLAATSTGDFDINLTLGSLIQISSLDDMTLTYTPGAAATNTESFCVYTNAASGTYEVTASSANENAGAFRLANGGNFIPYTLEYDTVTLTSSATNDNGGAGFAANTAAADCGGAEPVDAVVTAAEADILAVPSGTYSDTVTLLVEPL